MDDRQLVRALKALADPKRFRMVQEIASAGELSCGQLGERFALSQPTISHHLKLLCDAGVLLMRHDAKHHFLSVNHALLAALVQALPVTLVPKRRARSKAPRRPTPRA